MEFYTLVSEELQNKSLNMWIDENSPNKDDSDKEQSQFVFSPYGLYPLPKKPTPASKVTAEKPEDKQGKKEYSTEALYYFLGIFIAKAFLDGRILDLPFSPAFYKLVLRQELFLGDLVDITSQAKFITRLFNFSKKKLAILSDSTLTEEAKKEKVSIAERDEFQGKIEDMCLNFTLPGISSYKLKDDGDDLILTVDNLEEFLDLALSAFLKPGVSSQVKSFTDGFNSVFPLENLSAFSPSEFDTLLCGHDSKGKWDASYLKENILCDHGFSSGSRAVEFLLEIMSELDCNQQRDFLRFITGTPRLPIGGFKNLQPRLTIVRKDQHPPDDYLPSVSSCFHFLKLPDYSSKNVMKARLLYAIKSGQGSFDFN